MSVHLLDVNVLIALGWPNYSHHDSARRWFHSIAAGGWATCPLTQCAFVRISSNPKAVGAALTPAQAVSAISRITTHPQHNFWPDDLPIASTHFASSRLRGHQQITDAYSVALAASRGGKLATFDSAILAISNDVNLVSVIPA